MDSAKKRDLLAASGNLYLLRCYDDDGLRSLAYILPTDNGKRRASFLILTEIQIDI